MFTSYYNAIIRFISFIYFHQNDDDDEKYKYNNDNDVISLFQHQDTTRHYKYMTIIDENTQINNKFGDNFSYWICDKSRNNYVSPKFNSLKQNFI